MTRPMWYRTWGWKFTPRGFRHLRQDGLRLIPRRPPACDLTNADRDNGHCWRCGSWWYSCPSCHPELYGLPPRPIVHIRVSDQGESTFTFATLQEAIDSLPPEGGTIRVRDIKPLGFDQ